METIHTSNLSIGYARKKNRKVVASGITESIQSGELTCLLGSNGVGKSTLLRTFSAFQPKLGGEIWIKGRKIENYSNKELSRVVSIVLTEKPDVRNMQVAELVAMGRNPYTGFWGRLSANDREVVRRSLKLVGIEHLAQRMIYTLSDGERQKAMIAKALAQETPVVLLDEPTAFLDYPSKVDIMQLLQRLSRDTDKTIFLSTHDLDLALQMADKIWLMREDTSITVGTPEDLALDGSLTQFYSGRCIYFDEEIGLFRVKKKTGRSIRVIGTPDTRVQALCRALERHGIRGGDCPEGQQRIEVTPGEFLLVREGQVCARSASIDGILKAL